MKKTARKSQTCPRLRGTVRQKKKEACLGAQYSKYLYCIVKAKVPWNKFKLKGLEGKDIRVIQGAGLSCFISDTLADHYPLWREHIIAHQGPIEEIMKHYDVLPFSFSNIAKTADQVRERILKERKDEFKELFQKYQGKTEIGIKVLWKDMKSVFQEIAQDSPEFQHLKKNSRLSYQKKIAAGELVAKLLKEKKSAGAIAILDHAKDLHDGYKELEQIGEKMILNAAFLINKGGEKKFYQKIQEFIKEHKELKIHYSGPFPLYNFVNLAIQVV